jgi:hypothetical protein
MHKDDNVVYLQQYVTVSWPGSVTYCCAGSFVDYAYPIGWVRKVLTWWSGRGRAGGGRKVNFEFAGFKTGSSATQPSLAIRNCNLLRFVPYYYPHPTPHTPTPPHPTPHTPHPHTPHPTPHTPHPFGPTACVPVPRVSTGADRLW